MTNFKNLRAWCLTDGSAGMISQVKGLAEALNLNFEQKTIDLKFPWNKLPVGILPPSKIIFNNYKQISLESNIPPDIIISCGKRSIYASLHLKKSLKNKVFSIHIQNPKINPAHFDLVVAPAHDDLKGKNVLQTDLALNHINKRLLSKEAELYAAQFSKIEKPICAIFLGGQNRNYRFDISVVKVLADQVDKIIKNRVNKKSIGFNKSVNQDQPMTSQLENDDLIKFGLIPELVGRLPVSASLNELSLEDLKEILTKPKNAISKQYKALFSFEGVEFEITDDGREQIAQLAVEKKIGARGLRSIMEKLLLDCMFDIPDKDSVDKVVLSKESVISNNPIIVYKEKVKIKKKVGEN